MIAAIALTAIAACTSGNAKSSSDSSSSAGPGSLTLWSSWAKGEQGQVWMQAAIDDFVAQTGIKVNVQWKGSALQQQLLPAFNTKHVPADVVDASITLLNGTLAPGMRDMTSTYATAVPGAGSVNDVLGQKYRDFSAAANDDGTLGVPLSVPYYVSSYAFGYDSRNFPQLESSPPKNWDDMFALMDARKAAGKTPLALDGDISDYNVYYIKFATYSTVGDDGITKAEMDKTGQTWSQPGYLEAAQLVEKIAKGGYFAKGFDASKFPSQQNKWANDGADFLFVYTGIPSEVAPVTAPGFSYGSFPFPAVGTHPIPALKINGNGIGITEASKNVPQAQKFAAFLLQPKYQSTIGKLLAGIPVVKTVAADPQFVSLKTQLDEGHINISAVPPSVSDFQAKVLDPVDDELVTGKITAQQFIDQMVKATAEYWKGK